MEMLVKKDVLKLLCGDCEEDCTNPNLTCDYHRLRALPTINVTLDDIARCPFCGGEVAIIPDQSYNSDDWVIYHHEITECPIREPITVYGPTRDAVIQKWNTRKLSN